MSVSGVVSTPYASDPDGADASGRRPDLLLLLIYAIFLVRTAWIADDALITLRTVHNVLLGFGPVWNLGERVQAYTHPLWMLVLSSAIGVTHEYYYTVLLVAFAISLAAFYWFVRRLAVDAYAAVLGALILILSKAYVDYSTSGLENPLTYLLLVLFFLLYLATGAKAVNSPRRLALLALIAALGAVNRLDTLLLFLPPLLLASHQLCRFGSRTLLALVAGFLPLAAWEIFSLVYYGFPLPNTFYAKLAAGLPVTAQRMQGMLYLLDSVAVDPLTMATICAGLVLPLLVRNWRLGAIAAGIVLYMLYIVNAGGDFMGGRFLCAPLLCAAVIIVQQPLAKVRGWQQVALFAAVILLGAANPAHSPWFTTAGYDFRDPNSTGITDERGYYFQRQGLLNANRTNRLALSGVVPGATFAGDRWHTMMGIVGFTASPYTQIVDILALTDPLLARLPAFPNPSWVPGHLFRNLPNGYLGTRRTGNELIVDANLALYYARLATVVRGPLFTPERWREIWRFATGENAALLSGVTYTLPRLISKPWQDFDRNWSEHQAYLATHAPGAARGTEFATSQGLQVQLGELRHDRFLDLGMDASAFDVIYRNGEAEVGRQHVSVSPITLGGDTYTVVSVPAQIAEAGYNAIILAPTIWGGYNLTRVAAFTDAELAAPSLHVADLLRLYYFFYYRFSPQDRPVILATLLDAMRGRPQLEWAETPAGYKIDALAIDDPTLQALVVDHMPETQTVLSDESGSAKLRYLGYSPAVASNEDDASAIRLLLYFEVLAHVEHDYTLWFHIVNRATNGEFMIYDYTTPDGTTQWPVGQIYKAPVTLTLAPGDYDVSLGFWTPQSRERLYVDQANDAYWINLPPLKAEGGRRKDE